VRTYAAGRELEVELVSAARPGVTDEYACLAVQQPNFFGYLENVESLGGQIHAVGGLYLAAVEPVSLGLLQPPGAYGVDIAVGEGQPLGVPLQFGGPYVGIFTCRHEHLRQMPGRIVGRTTDADGRPGYVLTLQTREQHIRRERATSNICTSEQLLALAVTVYLSMMGRQGLREVAEQCYHKAHYAADRIARLHGYKLPVEGTFFNEFVVSCPGVPRDVNRWLLQRGVIGGYDVSDRFENGMVLCVTEVNSREEIDRLVEALAAFGGGA
jgi:glycine dehydrogenase subunit 1